MYYDIRHWNFFWLKKYTKGSFKTLWKQPFNGIQVWQSWTLKEQTNFGINSTWVKEQTNFGISTAWTKCLRLHMPQNNHTSAYFSPQIIWARRLKSHGQNKCHLTLQGHRRQDLRSNPDSAVDSWCDLKHVTLLCPTYLMKSGRLPEGACKLALQWVK